MKGIYVALIIVGSLILLTLLFSYILFLVIFYSKPRKYKPDYCPLPRGKRYEPYHEDMKFWLKTCRELPYKEYSITSYDGLKLYGKYYHFYDNAKMELMFHGYKGNSESDLSGGILRAKLIGRNVFVVDSRASGKSQGSVITFGVKEHLDCLKWVDFIVNNVDKNAQIILTGVSMGAATVVMASGYELPKNVIGVLADCGFTSGKNIIKDVVKSMKLPPNIIYPFIWLGAKIFGNFDISSKGAEDYVKNSTVPVLFIHGEDDDYVPYQMSEVNYNNCTSKKKKLVIVKGAGHALCYMANSELYLKEITEFFD